ncbi:hypothetical protein NRY95_07940 [Xanthomonas campestris pv. phormiicola]|nr:hypothetical protein [Xanthomonas campestris pv. phormiicola]UYC17873.1 hypothetical protein NRY95_07940 [Xanthomonas campestris pv. phormiicola]
MNLEHTVATLDMLAQLRARELDAAGEELRKLHAIAERMRHNLQRMRDMLGELGRNDGGSAALASNSAHYKLSLLDMITVHSRDLRGQEARIQASRDVFDLASLQYERITRALHDKRGLLRQLRHAQDQKRQDQLALQSWVHARHARPTY